MTDQVPYDDDASSRSSPDDETSVGVRKEITNIVKKKLETKQPSTAETKIKPYTGRLRDLPSHHDKDDKATNPGGRDKITAVGLHNPDIRCYQNAVLQTLFHYPRFASYLRQHHHDFALCRNGKPHYGCTGQKCKDCCSQPKCLRCHLKIVLDQYWTASATVNSAKMKECRDLLHELMTRPDNSDDPNDDHYSGLPNATYVIGHGQADPKEFLIWLSKGLMCQQQDSAIKPLLGTVPYLDWARCPNANCDEFVEEQEEELGITLGNADSWDDTTTLPQLLRAYWRQQLRPKTCGKEACRSIDRSIDKDSKTTGPPVNVLYHRYFKAFPDLLPISLIPFWSQKFPKERTARNMQTEHIPDIPPFLNLSAWDLFPERSKAGSYRLHAVIAHSGTSVNAGHYKVVLRDAEENWVEFDDKHVSGPFMFVNNENRTTKDGSPEVPDSAKNRWSACGWKPIMVFYRLGEDAEETIGKAKAAAPKRTGKERKTKTDGQQKGQPPAKDGKKEDKADQTAPKKTRKRKDPPADDRKAEKEKGTENGKRRKVK